MRDIYVSKEIESKRQGHIRKTKSEIRERDTEREGGG